MKATKFIAAAAVVGLGVLGGAAMAADHAFVGATKCKMCHNKPTDGTQYDVWAKSGHAKAFEVLAGEEAKKIATAKGIADPQTCDACLKCHVTGHGAKAELLGEKYAKTEGVTCESCHGAGGDYFKTTVMKAIAAGTTDPATVGLVKPTKDTCVTCHNDQSPTFKGFVFEEAVKKIAHKKPAAKG